MNFCNPWVLVSLSLSHFRRSKLSARCFGWLGGWGIDYKRSKFLLDLFNFSIFFHAHSTFEVLQDESSKIALLFHCFRQNLKVLKGLSQSVIGILLANSYAFALPSTSVSSETKVASGTVCWFFPFRLCVSSFNCHLAIYKRPDRFPSLVSFSDAENICFESISTRSQLELFVWRHLRRETRGNICFDSNHHCM